MKRYLGISSAVTCGALLFAGIAVAKPNQPLQHAVIETEVDAVGDVNGTPAPSKVLQDTVWIADWNFDGGSCNSTGWVKWDNRILNVNNDADFWHVNNSFAGQGGVIVGNAAILSKHDLCWAQDGYGNDNDFSIILKYSGAAATLDFDKASDSEPGFDFVTVEADSLGLSETLSNPSTNPEATSPAAFRLELLSTDGLDTGSHVGPVMLTDFGPGVHEAYIRFFSDGGFSDEDGDYPTLFQAGLVVDNIVVAGGIAYGENFEGALNAKFLQSPWLRLFSHITDNDKCTENTTCAWLGTDPLRTAFQPDMGFAPGGAVIRNWLDDIVSSPWVSLASTPSATGTVLSFRRFPGNPFGAGEIVQGWRVRAKSKVDNTDTTVGGDSVDCVTPWGHASQFNSLAPFQWLTSIFDMTPHFTPTAAEIQVSFRTVDWQYLTGAGPPSVLNTGPGPFFDRVRIGRRVLTGPVISEGIDSRTQANDAFPTVVDPSIVPGQHHVPDAGNRFGTCAFSEGTELGINTSSTRYVSGDSIQLESVVNALGVGREVTSVQLLGRIVSGPHAGKVPGPFTHTFSTPGSFFAINADSARNSSGTVVANRWFVDVNDDYFRGGDAMKYFWACSDNGGGLSTTPSGITAAQYAGGTISVATAELATGGLHEVNYLPTIVWDAGYLAAVAADDFGDVAPTAPQLANSYQKNCILYYQKLVSRRRSGDVNRTSFMFTLDDLGYKGEYDVYDVQGYGNTCNQLITRANVAQCTGYALIIQDDGRSTLVPNVPAGEDVDGSQFDQASWYRSYLAAGVNSLAGTATLWLIGENTAFIHQSNPLFSTDMGLGTLVTDQALSVNPTVRGTNNFTFANGGLGTFTGDEFALNGGCPTIRAYDAISVPGAATVTHNYRAGMVQGNGAIAMNRNVAQKWNTVWMGFGWFDIRFSGAPTNPGPQRVLASKIIAQTVPTSIDPDGMGPLAPVACNPAGGTTDTPGDDPVIEAPPAVTSLHQNVPNPFNPTTKISFDLARNGQVKLQVFNVAGHLVKTLVDGAMPAKRGHEVVWNGLDEAGNRVPSGVYFYQLVTDELTATKKMALLK